MTLEYSFPLTVKKTQMVWAQWRGKPAYMTSPLEKEVTFHSLNEAVDYVYAHGNIDP